MTRQAVADNHPDLTHDDGLIIAALSDFGKTSRMDVSPGRTEEGDFYLTVALPSGEPFLTFSQIGDMRAIFGPGLYEDILWDAGSSFLLALGASLPAIRDSYERLAA